MKLSDFKSLLNQSPFWFFSVFVILIMLMVVSHWVRSVPVAILSFLGTMAVMVGLLQQVEERSSRKVPKFACLTDSCGWEGTPTRFAGEFDPICPKCGSTETVVWSKNLGQGCRR